MLPWHWARSDAKMGAMLRSLTTLCLFVIPVFLAEVACAADVALLAGAASAISLPRSGFPCGAMERGMICCRMGRSTR